MVETRQNVLKLLFIFVLFLGVDVLVQAQVDTTNRKTTTRNNNVGTMNEQQGESTTIQEQQGGNNVDAGLQA